MGGIRTFCVVAGAALAVAGCSSESSGSPSPTTPKSGSLLGPAGSDCPLPVSFEVAEKWKPKAVSEGVARQGGFALACEIDAKPAGHLGFLRVWTSKNTGGARKALDEYMATNKFATVPEFSEPQVASTTAAEVTYVHDNPASETKKRERIVVVATPTGAVLLHLGGLDDDEHKDMLPALELAKKTMRIG